MYFFKQEAINKYGDVACNLEFAKELLKQFMALTQDVSIIFYLMFHIILLTAFCSLMQDYTMCHIVF